MVTLSHKIARPAHLCAQAGFTALMYAVKHNSQEIADILIKNGAQKDLQNKATAGRGVTGYTRPERWNSGDSCRCG